MSAFIVKRILHAASPSATICIHRLAATGELSVANFMHFGSSRSTILSDTLPIGALMLMLSLSNARSFILSSGSLSRTFSMLLKSLSMA